MMNLNEFTNEGKKLARSGMLFREQGEGLPVAYWHGFQDSGPCFTIEHDDRWLNVYVDRTNQGGSVKVVDSPGSSGMPLFAESFASLPPVDGVFLLGSAVVGRMLEALNWPRDEPFNTNFPNPLAEEYEGIWQETCPMYLPDISIATGCWHFPWPDGDWHDYVNMELVAWSLRESEPWVEVFFDGNTYIVKQRST